MCSGILGRKQARHDAEAAQFRSDDLEVEHALREDEKFHHINDPGETPISPLDELVMNQFYTRDHSRIGNPNLVVPEYDPNLAAPVQDVVRDRSRTRKMKSERDYEDMQWKDPISTGQAKRDFTRLLTGAKGMLRFDEFQRAMNHPNIRPELLHLLELAKKGGENEPTRKEYDEIFGLWREQMELMAPAPSDPSNTEQQRLDALAADSIDKKRRAEASKGAPLPRGDLMSANERQIRKREIYLNETKDAWEASKIARYVSEVAEREQSDARTMIEVPAAALDKPGGKGGLGVAAKMAQAAGHRAALAATALINKTIVHPTQDSSQSPPPQPSPLTGKKPK